MKGILICTLVAMSSGLAVAEQVRLSDTPVQLTDVDTQGRRATVDFLAEGPPPQYPYLVGYRWGTERRPDAIVKRLAIQVNGSEVFVPISAYADLANPSIVTLTHKGNFQLTVRGGDAAAAYEAVITFNSIGIVHRKVRSLSFPKSAWEETKYAYTIDTQ